MSTPDGTVMGAFPILDMALPDEADDFAANTQPLRLPSGHETAGGGDDRHPEAPEDLGQLVFLGIDATTRLTDALHLSDHPAAILGVLQVDEQGVEMLTLPQC